MGIPHKIYILIWNASDDPSVEIYQKELNTILILQRGSHKNLLL